MSIILKALDELSVALANHGHVWSPELRRLYGDAVEEAKAMDKRNRGRSKLWRSFPSGAWCVPHYPHTVTIDVPDMPGTGTISFRNDTSARNDCTVVSDTTTGQPGV